MKKLITKIKDIIVGWIADKIIEGIFALILIVIPMMLNIFGNIASSLLRLENPYLIAGLWIIQLIILWVLVLALIIIISGWFKKDSHSISYLQDFNQLLKDFYNFIDERTTYSLINLSSNSFDELHPINSHYWEVRKRFEEKQVTESIVLDKFIDEFNSLFNSFQIMLKKFKNKKPAFEKSVISFSEYYPSLMSEYNDYRREYIKLNKKLNRRINLPEVLTEK